MTQSALPTTDHPFEAPWQAQAFALAVHLHERGLFTWPEWAQALGQAIAHQPQAPYYNNWLQALEHLMRERAGVHGQALERWRQAWAVAARNTPHGQPIAPPHLVD